MHDVEYCIERKGKRIWKKKRVRTLLKADEFCIKLMKKYKDIIVMIDGWIQ